MIKVEFSAGWGQTGVIGKLSLKFTNFSLANLLHPGENYRGILPQGDGQTLTISGQTNAQYYQQYSISFFDPGSEVNARIHSLCQHSSPYRPISVAVTTIQATITTTTTVITAAWVATVCTIMVTITITRTIMTRISQSKCGVCQQDGVNV